jgi:hypothetical protein
MIDLKLEIIKLILDSGCYELIYKNYYLIPP